MKIRFKGETSPLELTHGKTYDVVSEERGWYRIVDDSGEDYLYPPQLFEILKDRGGKNAATDKDDPV